MCCNVELISSITSPLQVNVMGMDIYHINWSYSAFNGTLQKTLCFLIPTCAKERTGAYFAQRFMLGHLRGPVQARLMDWTAYT